MLAATSLAALAGLRLRFETDDGLLHDARRCTAPHQRVPVAQPDGAAVPAVPCTSTVTTDCYYNCTRDDILDDFHTTLLADLLLPAVARWFDAALELRDAPPAALSVAGGDCGFHGPLDIPSDYVASGAAETDVLILLTARPIPSPSALALAGSCQEDAGSSSPYRPRRPTVGHLNLDPATLTAHAEAAWSDATIVERTLKVLIHEVFHVLGFSYSKILQFPCPLAPGFDRHRGGSLEPRGCGGASPASPAPVGYHARRRNGATYSVLGVRTPKVLLEARRHFNCSESPAQAADELRRCAGAAGCIDHVPLERHGGEGTESVHWEQRIAKSELMTSTIASAYSPISRMTLALFEDSGWFVANYGVPSPGCFYSTSWCYDARGQPAARQQLEWGAGRGCDFVSGWCDGAAWAASGYFCNTTGDESACTAGLRAVGHCSLTRHRSEIEAQFQYFSDPEMGGEMLDDYCPVWTAYSNYDCGFVGPTATEAAFAAQAARQRGEARCEACRCALSTLYNDSFAQAAPQHGCYEHRCLSPRRLQFRVGGSWRDCNAHGGAIAIRGWTGLLRCPSASELCASAPDLGWPEIVSVAPARGPVGGGTRLAIAGRGLAAPQAGARVFVCEVEATDAVVLEGGHRVDATSSPLVGAHYGQVVCDVRVVTGSGLFDEAAGSFVYLGPAPPQPPLDVSNGLTADLALALAMRAWPYVMTIAVGVGALRVAFLVMSHFAHQRRLHLSSGPGARAGAGGADPSPGASFSARVSM